MPPDQDTETARAQLQRPTMAAFCNVLHATRLPPMTVMSLAADAVGYIYKEGANEHRASGACPCGWQPNPRTDVEVLQAALATRTQTVQISGLRRPGLQTRARVSCAGST
jgi:hypothetical protein